MSWNIVDVERFLKAALQTVADLEGELATAGKDVAMNQPQGWIEREALLKRQLETARAQVEQWQQLKNKLEAAGKAGQAAKVSPKQPGILSRIFSGGVRVVQGTGRAVVNAGGWVLRTVTGRALPAVLTGTTVATATGVIVITIVIVGGTILVYQTFRGDSPNAASQTEVTVIEAAEATIPSMEQIGSEMYGIYLLPDVCDGTVGIFTESDLQRTRRCERECGEACRNDGTDPLILYKLLSSLYPTYEEAKAAYCKENPVENVGYAIGGTKSNTYGGNYWMDVWCTEWNSILPGQ